MSRSGMSRRDFLRISGGAGGGLFFIGQIGGRLFRVPVAAAQIPGGSLDPRVVPKYRTPMLIPPVMPRADVMDSGRQAGRLLQVSVRQFAQQILPARFPATTVWGYGATAARHHRGLLIHNAPSLTIEARHDRPVRVRWTNDLVDGNGNSDPTCCRSIRRSTGPTPRVVTPGVTRDRLRLDAWPVHGTGSARHPRARRRRRRRRERRLRRVVVPARGRRHPVRLRHRRHVVRLLRR